jgi:hypothetical protein
MTVKALLPPWPHAIPATESPRARLVNCPRLLPHQRVDALALQHARRLRGEFPTMSGTTGTWSECMWVNNQDFSAFASSASEGSLLSGVNDQPVIPAFFFLNRQGRSRAISLLARGVLGTTGTPTIIFQVRIGSTAGSSTLTGTSVGVSAAITTGNGVTNKWWELRLDLVCTTPGIGTGNCTLAGSGYVQSPTGFASPFVYPLEPTTPDTATWTNTIDAGVSNYVNLSVTWSASSASNTITLKQLLLLGLN